MFFKIILPNYNSEKWIKKCIDSILEQTFKDFILIITDDLSTDKSPEIIKSYKDERIVFIPLKEKRYNGGSRNAGIDYKCDSKYTLFIDCDDWFDNENCLEEIHKVAKRTNADCIRLPYVFIKGEYRGDQTERMATENTPYDVVNSVYVAPWTKAIKSELVARFPENTMLEDVVQHIAQVDKIESVAVVKKPIINWNRNNEDAISQVGNAKRLYPKRISDIFRNIANLMDLELKHDYCEDVRKWRVNCYKEIVRNGEEENQ